MINIRETEYLAEVEGAPIVVKIKEHYFLGLRYKVEEMHSYNNALIQAFKAYPEPKKPKPIGFKINTKKKKKNENKSKVS